MAIEVVRGSTIVWAVGFTDIDGLVTNPSSATLYLSYRVSGVATVTQISMTQTGNTWGASWDSGAADGGRVDWHVRSAGSNKAALEGSIDLTTNNANPSQ